MDIYSLVATNLSSTRPSTLTGPRDEDRYYAASSRGLPRLRLIPLAIVAVAILILLPVI